MAKSVDASAQRRKLLGEIERLAAIAIFGTLSETYRTCLLYTSSCIAQCMMRGQLWD